MLTSTNIHELDGNDTNRLLARIQDWRSGICPDGTLATESCFVLKQRPIISIHPDQPITDSSKQLSLTTEIITERDWSNNLVDCGAITHLNDDWMIKTLSSFYMIFHHAFEKVENCNTLHLLQIRKHASFKVDNIERPTKSLQFKLDELLATNDNIDTKWRNLMDIWNVFGYFWPRKIVLGYRTHLKATYKFVDIVDGLNGFYYHVSKLKDTHQREIKNDPPFSLEDFFNNATIIARQEMTPIHDFLDEKSRSAIEEIIHTKFMQIPIHHPIKIYNVSTDSYLCWDPYGHSQQDPSFDGEVHDFLVRAVSAELSELNTSPESQYLWRFTRTPITVATPPIQPSDAAVTETKDMFFDPAKHRPQTLGGCTNVYIYPACKSVSPKSKKSSLSSPKTSFVQRHQSWQINDRLIDEKNLVDTYKMVLSCRPYRYEAKSVHPEFSKLRALRLLASESPQCINEKIDWTIEYPNNNLKYMNDAHANIKLNIHEHIRRLKPLIHGDVIQLQQIGLLTAFHPINKANGPQQQHEERSQHQTRPTKHLAQQQSSVQSLRSTKRISVVTRKPSLKSKNKKNVLCVDEDITVKENTLWRVECATKVDMIRHSSNFVRWPPQADDNQYQEFGYPTEYHPLLSEDVRNHLSSHLNKETGSLISNNSSTAAASSLRRTRSLGSIANLSIHARDDSEKAVYFEDLVTAKSKTKILSQIAKVSLQPLAQLVKPSKSKQHNQMHISPPPFSSYTTS